MTINKVRVTAPNGQDGVLSIHSTILRQYILHACGGGFNEQEVVKAMEASHTLHEGGEVVMGNWRFEAVKED